MDLQTFSPQSSSNRGHKETTVNHRTSDPAPVLAQRRLSVHGAGLWSRT